MAADGSKHHGHQSQANSWQTKLDRIFSIDLDNFFPLHFGSVQAQKVYGETMQWHSLICTYIAGRNRARGLCTAP